MIAPLVPFLENREIAGAVSLIASKNEVLSEGCLGHSDIENNIPMRAETMFWIGSMTKIFTAAAVMTLVDEKKLSLDDTIIRYIPQFKEQLVILARNPNSGGTGAPDHLICGEPQVPVTIRHLLTHTSGLNTRTILERYHENYTDRLQLRDHALINALPPRHFEAGQKLRYSNAGINIAGRIVEIVTNQRIEEFLHDRFFSPLGMHDTTFWPHAIHLPRLAKSYDSVEHPGSLREVPIELFTYPLTDRSRGVSAGAGLFSAMRDLYKFARMIWNQGSAEGARFLSPESITLMTSTQTGEATAHPDFRGYGCGWLTELNITGDNADRSGSFGINGLYNTCLWIYPRHGLMMLLLAQQAGKAEQQRRQLRATFSKEAIRTFSRG